jgi:hypothetical protein
MFPPPGRAPVLTASRLKYLYLAYFSKPACDRVLYRAMARQKVQRILEIGLGDACRAQRLISVAHRCAGGEAVRYTAIDLFEARPAGMPGLPLKDAHKLLKATGAQVQLIPGDPASALARSANALQNLDLILISAGHDEAQLVGAWFYFPRMLHTGSAVYIESRHGDAALPTLTRLSASEIESRANAGRRRRAA